MSERIEDFSYRHGLSEFATDDLEDIAARIRAEAKAEGAAEFADLLLSILEGSEASNLQVLAAIRRECRDTRARGPTPSPAPSGRAVAFACAGCKNPRARVDEDGCCVSCGCTAVPITADGRVTFAGSVPKDEARERALTVLRRLDTGLDDARVDPYVSGDDTARDLVQEAIAILEDEE